MATSGFGMLQQDASFKVSCAAFLSFGLLFLTFICRFRASLALNKSKRSIQRSLFITYPRYVINSGLAFHKSPVVQIIFLLSLSFPYFLVLPRPWILLCTSVVGSSLRITWNAPLWVEHVAENFKKRLIVQTGKLSSGTVKLHSNSSFIFFFFFKGIQDTELSLEKMYNL